MYIPTTYHNCGSLILSTFAYMYRALLVMDNCYLHKADMIDDGNDTIAGTSGMGSMVKGWEERTDGIMQVL